MKDPNTPILVFQYECTNVCTLQVNPNFVALPILLVLLSISSIMLIRHLINCHYYHLTKRK